MNLHFIYRQDHAGFAVDVLSAVSPDTTGVADSNSADISLNVIPLVM